MVVLRASLPAWQRRLVASGSSALDVVHTGGVGAWVEADLVTDEEALAFWLGVVLEREVAAGQALPAFRGLREALFRCFGDHVSDRACRQQDVDVLNGFALGPALPVALDVRRVPVLAAVPVDAALAHVAREAIVLMTGPLRGRVRECAADDCGLLFVDRSRPGLRQWCSMARCGNIAKTRAYRARTSP